MIASNSPKRMATHRNSRQHVFALGFAAVAAVACGGTEDEPRPEEPAVDVLEPLVDTGSAPADCSAEDDYEIYVVEDWETGAGPGWYSNNEYCQPCTDIQNLLDDVSRPANCLALGAPGSSQSTGCDPTVPTDPDVRDEVVDDLRSAVQHYLPDANPSDDELELLSAAFKLCDEFGEADCTVTDSQASIEDLFAELLPDVRAALEESAQLREELGECRVTCDPTQTPPTLSKPFPSEDIPGGRCGSTKAAHVQLHRWISREGTLGRSFSPSAPFDASEYEGVSFWARTVPGARSMFRLSLPDAFTDENSEVDGVPVCQFINPKELTDNSCDKFGKYFLTTSDWQFITIPFSEMRQAGFGKQAPYFDITRLLGIGFDYKQGQWDFWIDDVGFYRKK